MPKSYRTYWNALVPENASLWTAVEGSDGKVEFSTLAIDDRTGDYTRLTRFLPGADTTASGGKSHDYPEEVYIVSGRLYDHAFGRWLEAGDYASRPPGEVHGPFKTDTGCLVLEISYPSQARTA
jgi:quercetin dioxygenase-like cupin family protein